MSSFYARYIPGQNQPATIKEASNTNGTKRKRADGESDVNSATKKQRQGQIKDNRASLLGLSQSETASGTDILQKYRVTSAAKKDNNAEVKIRKPQEQKSAERDSQADDGQVKNKTGKKEKRSTIDKADREQEASESKPQEGDIVEEDLHKHRGILSNFGRAKKKRDLEKSRTNERVSPPEDTASAEQVELHGLEPIPQPVEVETVKPAPTYSTLPTWLSEPMRISAKSYQTTTFDALGVSKTLVSSLKEKGVVQPFPVQEAVVPLLLPGNTCYEGDLAVSAATGSGKTLAYVLPIVEALKDLVTTKLRAVIVMPTRELVKQVQDVFDYCAAGTSIKIFTALGSKSIKDEQEALIDEFEIYDSKEYKREREAPVDWLTFSLSGLLQKVSDQRLPSINYVTKYRSKVDVLICTPGRLVEHLRSTEGFNLDDVRWLIIDEVDRLLNESYQEWIEVVMPALESRTATRDRDQLLRHLKMDTPRRDLRKIILSATMTHDISKLNSLNLWRPKLVVLETQQKSVPKSGDEEANKADELVPDTSGAFRLPETLSEFAVAAGDGSYKPLFLLELLNSRCKEWMRPTNSPQPTVADDTSSDSSSESTSSAGDSSDEGSTSAKSPPSRTNGTTTADLTDFQSTLVFTRSAEAAARLSRLLSLLEPRLANQLATLTKSTSRSASSRKALRNFREGKIALLITTDRASRGLDVANIAHVVSYDVPASAQSYVHRVGRTARAGTGGTAWTLLTNREAGWFWRVIGKGTGEETILRPCKVKRVTLHEVGKDKELLERYESALKQLGEEVRQQ